MLGRLKLGSLVLAKPYRVSAAPPAVPSRRSLRYQGERVALPPPPRLPRTTGTVRIKFKRLEAAAIGLVQPVNRGAVRVALPRLTVHARGNTLETKGAANSRLRGVGMKANAYATRGHAELELLTLLFSHYED